MKPRVFKRGSEWVGKVGILEFSCNNWRTALFNATFHLKYPITKEKQHEQESQ